MSQGNQNGRIIFQETQEAWTFESDSKLLFLPQMIFPFEHA
jgi:hypothetical protein